MKSVVVKVELLSGRPDLALPKYATELAAGVDILAAHAGHIEPGQRTLVKTGLAIELPVGFEAQIRPRSGLALRYGVTVLNAPGTIDADYRGEIQVLLVNLGDEVFHFQVGDRIAQMVIAPVCQIEWSEAVSLRATTRGGGGFGHTGR